jgi:mono/diheme cytochrome c family protein
MMKKTIQKKLALLFCLLAVAIYSACNSSQPETTSAKPAAPTGTSVESAAKAKESAVKSGNAPAAALASEPIMNEDALEAFNKSCKQCHGPDGRGIAGVAGDIHKAPKRAAEVWEKYLRDPKSIDPNTEMQKPKGLDDEGYKALAAYLADLTQNNPESSKK